MAFTQENFDNLLCKLKRCMADLGDSAVKNKTFGDESLFCEKIPIMKSLSVIQYVLNWEYNARYGTCSTCLCGGKSFTDTDVLACPEACLDDSEICDLSSIIDQLCARVKGTC